MSDELIKQIEELVAAYPDYFDCGVDGLTPLEKAYLKLHEGITDHIFKKVGLEPLRPGLLIQAPDNEN